MDKYLDYWDNVIRQWADGDGVVPESEQCWFVDGQNLHRELMPEPYWGNPDCCSAVLLNYNPGGPKGTPPADDNCHINNVRNADTMKMSGAMHSSYSRIALDFPWLDETGRGDFTSTSSHLPTKRWMTQRNRWISRLIESEKRPFFLDLCGWHSKNWSLRNYTPEIKAYIEEYVIPVVKQAIRNSDLGIGLCVGKQLGDEVLVKLGFMEVTAKYEFDNYEPDCGYKAKPEVNRWYRIYRSSDGIYIINTWSIGSNRQPGKRFDKEEAEIIKRIKELKTKY